MKLATVAMRQSVFARIVATRTLYLGVKLSHTTYTWTNILLPFLQDYNAANGVKTGSNDNGTDWCMVFSARRNGHPLIGAETQALSMEQAIADAERLLDRGFALPGQALA